ncbi:MAG: hypothetical protein QM813_26965 [Verrucomicrobiota bacterium]
MKTIIAVVLLVVSLAPAAVAQYGQAIKRAKETANQNNVRQGVPPPAPAQPATPPANGTTPAATIPQAQTLAALKSDLAGFKAGASVTDAQKQQFTINLAKAARSNKPSLGTVKKFVDSLSGALSTASLTDEQNARLASDIDTVLNSRSLSATVFDKTVDDTQAILQVGSITRTTALSVAADLKAVGTEVRR